MLPSLKKEVFMENLKKIDQKTKDFEIFQKNLDELMKTHKDEYVLMKNGEIIQFHKSFEEAYWHGRELDKEDEKEAFSIQKVTKTPINLGFFSCNFLINSI